MLTDTLTTVLHLKHCLTQKGLGSTSELVFFALASTWAIKTLQEMKVNQLLMVSKRISLETRTEASQQQE